MQQLINQGKRSLKLLIEKKRITKRPLKWIHNDKRYKQRFLMR